MRDREIKAQDTETEWQFEVDDLGRVRAWLESQPEHAPLRFALRKDAEQVDAYYDTADWRLFLAGYSLRRRRRDAEFEVTLKSLDRGNPGDHGLVSRREINETSEDGQLPGASGPVSDRVRTIAGHAALQHLFEVRTRRRSYAVTRHDEVVAQVELDETTVASPSTPATTTFRRVEVETTAGPPSPDLESFVQAMRYANGLAPVTTSKFEAGLRAASLDPSAALDFGSTTRSPGLGAAEYAYAWLREHWAAFLRHAPGTRAGEDIEALHQMRVATRRLRATIRVFDAVLPAPFEEYRSELQWVGHELGAVRDLDVQIEGLEKLRAASSWEDAAALRPLIEVIEAERRDERVRLLELLDSARYDRLVQRFSEALRQGPPFGTPSPEIYAYAQPILERRFRRVRKDGRALREDSPAAAYHELRIRGKRLRYSLEVFGELYGRPAERMTASLKALQDMLGDHQDAEVGRARLRAITAQHGRALPPETLVAIGTLMEQYRQQEVALRTEFRRDFSEVLDRWRPLSRLIARAAARRTAPEPDLADEESALEDTLEHPAPESPLSEPPPSEARTPEARTPEAKTPEAQTLEDSPRTEEPPRPLWSPPSPVRPHEANGDVQGTLARMRQLFHRE